VCLLAIYIIVEVKGEQMNVSMRVLFLMHIRDPWIAYTELACVQLGFKHHYMPTNTDHIYAKASC
jgi:hypothetical protein